MEDQHLTANPAKQEKQAEAPAFDPANLIGRVLDGRYELIKCVGRGGMGVVYLAHQSALGRDVVVKLLPPNFADDADALARFQREARGMSKLQHPHIVSVYDFGIEQGQAYIVMEYVAGITLRRFVREQQGPDGMSFERFGTIALQIIEGLSSAHAMGLVHRDIKPSNIMLTQRGNAPHYVKILDFGLAKLVKGAQDITREQGLVGSVGYLSPEQILGNDSDERVDVYALGVLFYYMLCGEKPFVGDEDVAVLYKHVHQAPEPLGRRVNPAQQIPESAIALIHRMLSKSPDKRPADARALLQEFGACLEGVSIRSAHVSGEFGAASLPVERSGGERADPSSEFETDRLRRQTPMAHMPANATATHSGVIATSSGSFSSASGSWVSGEHLLKVERQNRTRNILLALLGLLILGVAALLVWQNNGSAPADTVSVELGTGSTQAEPSEPVIGSGVEAANEALIERANDPATDPASEPAGEVDKPALPTDAPEPKPVEFEAQKPPAPDPSERAERPAKPVSKPTSRQASKSRTPPRPKGEPRAEKKAQPKPVPPAPAAEPGVVDDLLPTTDEGTDDDLLMP